jgi:hypothetical protein
VRGLRGGGTGAELLTNSPPFPISNRFFVRYFSRAWKKNDSTHVEQKNGAIVRHLIGYDRFVSKAGVAQLQRVPSVARKRRREGAACLGRRNNEARGQPPPGPLCAAFTATNPGVRRDLGPAVLAAARFRSSLPPGRARHIPLESPFPPPPPSIVRTHRPQPVDRPRACETMRPTHQFSGPEILLRAAPYLEVRLPLPSVPARPRSPLVDRRPRSCATT